MVGSYSAYTITADHTAHIGDTICLEREQVEPLPGFKPMKAMVSCLSNLADA